MCDMRVQHDSLIRLIHLCDVREWYASLTFICVTSECDMTHWYVWHESATWLIHMCDIRVRHDSFTCMTWECDMTHSYDPFTCAICECDVPVRRSNVWLESVTWLIHMCDMRVRHDSFICVTWQCDMTHSHESATWLIHMCDMTVWHDIFICVTWECLHLHALPHTLPHPLPRIVTTPCLALRSIIQPQISAKETYNRKETYASTQEPCNPPKSERHPHKTLFPPPFPAAPLHNRYTHKLTTQSKTTSLFEIDTHTNTEPSPSCPKRPKPNKTSRQKNLPDIHSNHASFL